MSRTSTSKILASNFYGPEPMIPVHYSISQLLRAYSWYNYVKDPSDAVDYTLKFFQASDEEKSTFNGGVNPTVATTLGWTCRMIAVNPDLEGSALHTKAKSMYEDLMEKAKLNQIYRIEARANEPSKAETITNFLNAELEYLLENSATMFDLINYATKVAAPQYLVKEFRDRLEALLEDDDKDLDESTVASIERLMDDADKYCDIKKENRKPRKERKKKVKTPEQLLTKVQYQEADKELNLTSVKPETFLGASQLWVYNTKYKKLGCYYAMDGGFSIKGTTLQNFNEKTSKEKRLRKPEEVLKMVLESTKPACKLILPSIKTQEMDLTGRLGSDTILLRVFK